MTDAQAADINILLDEVFATVPLLFVKEFLRGQRRERNKVHIGGTRDEVRENLRDALLAGKVGPADVVTWLQEVEGWGRQHLYLSRVPKRSLNQPHLLNSNALKSFLKRKGLWTESSATDNPSQHSLREINVDDVAARITWRSHVVNDERHDELDYQVDRDDGEYAFRAYRLVPVRTASRIIVRKTDGIVAQLVDLPLGVDHDRVRDQMNAAARQILAPLALEIIYLSPIVSALDQGSIASFGPRARRALDVGVAPTKARYRTDGAKIEFKSTRESTGYNDSDAMRHVRRALRIEQFEGEAGKFRLSFEGKDRQSHDMVVSLSAPDNRIYLYSRMSEEEVFSLVDQLVALIPKHDGR